MDEALLPMNLGVKWPERVQKWLAYKKAGIMWIDSTQEGRNDNGNAPMNTIFNGYDDTIKYQSIQAIQMAINAIEENKHGINEKGYINTKAEIADITKTETKKFPKYYF